MSLNVMKNRVREIRESKGLTIQQLADRLNVGWQTVQRVEKGISGLSDKKANLYAAALEVPPEAIFSGSIKFADASLGRSIPIQNIPVLGEVAAGVWLESDQPEGRFDPVPVVPNPNYPIEAQFGLVVRGTSMNKVAQDGEVMVCISVDQTALEAKEGDLVIVRREQHQGALIETTAKRLKVNGDFELWPESDDERFQEPLIIERNGAESDMTVRITAVVKGIYRDV